jgi:fibrillarin-like rRNA methylase
MRPNVHSIPIKKMFQFSTVKKACDFLTVNNKTIFDCKFEMLHGKRFYFVWRADLMPFNNYHRTLVCRGNKEQILAKLERLANAPKLPDFL